MSWTLLGELSFAACQWLSLMVVAKLGSPAALGRYSLGLAVATPIIVLANLHLRPIYVVDLRARWRFGHYLALRLVLVPAALMTTALVVALRGWPWQTAAVIGLLAIIRAAGSVSDIFYARAQRAEVMDPIGISRATRGVLWIGLLALGLALGDEVLALALVAAALVAHTLLYDRPQAARLAAADEPNLNPKARPETRREAQQPPSTGEAAGAGNRPIFDAAALRGLAWAALPMGLAAGLLGVTVNVPAYVLETSHGLEEVGFFAAVLSILQASGVVNMALGNAAVPRLAKLAHGQPREFWRLLAKLLALVVVLNGLGVALIAGFGELYLRVAYTPDYAVYLPQLLLASIAAVLVGLANMLSQTLMALAHFRLQLVLNSIALLISVAVSLWRIPAHGLDGAVETLLVLAGARLLLYLIANAAVGPRRPVSGPEASDPIASVAHSVDDGRDRR